MATRPTEGLTKQHRAAIGELYRRGDISWFLNPSQQKLIDWLDDPVREHPVICISRQWGKSTTLLLYAFAYCLTHPQSMVMFIAPLMRQLSHFIMPRINVCMSFLPEDCLPHRSAMQWTFPNGAILRCDGANLQKGTRLRGNSINLAILDECRDFLNLEEVVSDSLIPALSTTDGKIIMISTPPTTPMHPFTEKYINGAIKSENFFTSTYKENPLISAKMLKRLLTVDYPGGDTNISFRREYLADFQCADASRRVVAEWDDTKNAEFFETYAGVKLGTIYRPYLGLDYAFHDPAGVLAGYMDPHEGALIITDEYLERKVNTNSIGIKIKEMEQRLLATLPGHGEIIRVMDIDPSLMADLYSRFELRFEPCFKVPNALAMLNRLRVACLEGRIRVHPRCKELLFQLRAGVFDDKNKYLRTPRGGHLDLTDSLKYLCLNARWNEILHTPAPKEFAGSGQIMIPGAKSTGSFRGGLMRRPV